MTYHAHVCVHVSLCSVSVSLCQRAPGSGAVTQFLSWGDFLSQTTDGLSVCPKIRHESGRQWLWQEVDLYDPWGHWPWEPDAAVGSAPPSQAELNQANRRWSGTVFYADTRATAVRPRSLTQVQPLGGDGVNRDKNQVSPHPQPSEKEIPNIIKANCPVLIFKSENMQ